MSTTSTSLKTGLMFHLVLFCMSIALLPATPARAETVVTATGDPAQDVPNVQKAVERGGDVLLKGHFRFGPTGRVNIRKSVAIRGEVDSLDLPVTRITGGHWTLYTPLPVPGAPPAKKGPLVSVRDLHFNKAMGTPLHFPYISGLMVDNITVENLLPDELPVEWKEADTLAFAAGVVAGTRLDHRKASLQRAAQGVITIKNSRLYMMADKPDITAGRGVMVDWTWGATITVENNIITKASRNGIELLDNVRGDDGTGSILVRKNKIITDNRGIKYPNPFSPNGIVAGWFFDTSGGNEYRRNSPVTVVDNRVELRGESSTGIFIYSNDATIAGNDLILGGGSKTRGIIQTGSRGYIGQNRFRGKGQYAIFSVPFEKLNASVNIFAWNNFEGFTGYKGQMLLGGTLNRVLGDAMVNDKGKGNRVDDIPPAVLPNAMNEVEEWEPVETLN